MKRGRKISFLVFIFLVINIFIINSALAEILSNEITLDINVRGGIMCTDSQSKWMDATGDGDPVVSDTFNDCYREEGLNENTLALQQTCCASPSLFDCLQDPDMQYRCHERDNKIKICADFNGTDVYQCEGISRDGNHAIAEESIKLVNGKCGLDINSYKYDLSCGTLTTNWNVTFCDCKWNDTNKKCDAIQTVEKRSNTSLSNSGNTCITYGSCKWELEDGYPIDNCNMDGYLSYSFIGSLDPTGATYAGSEDCTKKQVQIPCESATKLGFFDLINFIEAIFVIALIYFIYVNKNKHKK